ncbi:MAG: AAA family ATPase [Sedimentisphaerales bacterium]|nr:AAA family ATPase [Sedimentisphaerales bacterium]
MFRSVHIRNFRTITDLQIEGLSRVNLFVGHNACGKTTLLESLFFLIGATNPKLPVSANALRGFPYVDRAVWPTYFHNMDVSIPIQICATDDETGEEQRLLIRPYYAHRGADQETPLPIISTSGAPTGSENDGSLNGLELEYHASADSTSRETSRVFIRDGKLVDEGTKPRVPRGTFVVPLPMDLKDRFSEVQRKKQVQEVVTLLKDIEPAVEDLRLLDPPGVLYADTGGAELIPVNLMGGGIMKLLSTAIAMLSMQDGFVLIDEIENGLGYLSQRRLWEAVFSWARKLNIQVFASTHSMECIRAFNDCAEGGLFGADAMLFRIERKGDDFRAVEYTRESLAESLESEWEVR